MNIIEYYEDYEDEDDLPFWFDHKRLNETAFCQTLIQRYHIVSYGGNFFTLDGIIADESVLKKLIYDELRICVDSGLPKKVKNLLEALRLEARVESLPMHTDRIHVANGTLWLSGEFSEEKSYCRNRLPVAYNPMLRSLWHGWIFSASYSTRRTFPLCRSSSATV